MNIFHTIFLGVVLLFQPIFQPVTALEKWQNRVELQQVVRKYIEDNIATPKQDYELSISPIDKRLKLVRCDTKIQAFLPPNGNFLGKSTIGVHCSGSQPWKVYIPVHITQYMNIVVSRQPLLKGHELDRDDLSYARMQLSSAQESYYSDIRHVIGKVLTRSLGSSKPIKAHYLKPAKLVKRGQEVILVAKTASVQVQMSGKALADGARGDLIRVRNTRTRRVVEGIVIKAGTVQVKM